MNHTNSSLTSFSSSLLPPAADLLPLVLAEVSPDDGLDSSVFCGADLSDTLAASCLRVSRLLLAVDLSWSCEGLSEEVAGGALVGGALAGGALAGGALAGGALVGGALAAVRVLVGA